VASFYDRVRLVPEAAQRATEAASIAIAPALFAQCFFNKKQ
jgi:hypothetical protein